MPEFWSSLVTLEALHAFALGRAYLRYRDPRRRASGAYLTAFYEQAWREAAEAVGARYEPIGDGILDIVRDGVRVRACENVSSVDDPVTTTLAGNKRLTYKLLVEAGVPTPRYDVFTFRTIARAFAFLQEVSKPCVVKPSAGTGGGRGVTTGITRRSELARAAAASSVYHDEFLIEEQVAGDNYRLLFLDGELLDAFVRKLPSVVGDGRSTVAKLVAKANADRLRSGTGVSQVLMTTDLDMKRTLARQGLSLRSVPTVGAEVTLKMVVNENRGADNTTATHRLCPGVVEAAARAAAALDVRLAGVDVITPDPSRLLGESGGAVIEVNTSPNFYFHYHKGDGCYPVAVHLLERLLNVPEGPAPPALGGASPAISSPTQAPVDGRLAAAAGRSGSGPS
jgi:D-alanine-D-alanine ligase-like ATP-grasp enzyme